MTASSRTVSLAAAAAALPVLALLGAACSSSSAPGAPQTGDDQEVRERQYGGRDLPMKTLALTFDDGPGERTEELAVYLHDQGIPASFFMLGKNAQGKGALLTKINSLGHIIGNHTWDHAQMTAISSQAQVDEVTKADAVLAPFYLNGMKMFRAPFGAWNASVASAINGTPMSSYVGSIFWDIGGELANGFAADWACWGHANLSTTDCGAGYMREINARGRGVVLMHDIHSKTIDMVKAMVPQLKASGYSFVRIDAVPSINADLHAAGATPPPGLPVTVGNPVAHECPFDGVFCGVGIHRDATKLYKCENQRLTPVCTCSNTCIREPRGVPDTCTCGDGT